MRIAVLVIGLLVSGVFGLQSILGFGLTGIAEGLGATDVEALSQASAVGVFAAFLGFVGTAFALGVPGASVIFLSLGGLLGVAIGADFPDARFWGVLLLILAVLELFVWRAARRARAARAAMKT